MQTLNSLGGNLYYFLLTNHFSRHSYMYFIRNKSNALHHFKVFMLTVEKQHSWPVKILCSDRGGVSTSKEFRTFCETTRIKQIITSCSPPQNGAVKWKNRTVTQMAQTMLKEMNVLIELQEEFVSTAVYISNLSPTSAMDELTPYEALTGRRPSFDHLRVFSCVCYIFIDPKMNQKMDTKSSKGVFIGNLEDSKAYKILKLVTRKAQISWNLNLFENKHQDQPKMGDSAASVFAPAIDVEGDNVVISSQPSDP